MDEGEVHRDGRSALAVEQLLAAPAQLGAALAFELIDRLRERAPRRQAAQRQRDEPLAPHHLGSGAPQVGEVRLFAEHRARQREQQAAIEPRLEPEDDEPGQPRRDLDSGQRDEHDDGVSRREAAPHRERARLHEAHAEVGRLGHRPRAQVEGERVNLHRQFLAGAWADPASR